MSSSLETYAEVERVVCWFSCGATSAVAAKLALKKYSHAHEVAVVYIDTGSEHPDNDRFLAECEQWFGHKITILKNPAYKDIYDVFEKTGFIVGPTGASCTAVLKKTMRHQFQRPWSDLQVFGFHNEELERAARFKETNPEVMLYTPLIDEGLDHADCLAMINAAGIEVPTMYKLGYNNNNCIGCVKGGQAYWGKIRSDFPDHFDRMAKIERQVGASVLRKKIAGQKHRPHVWLDELPEDCGDYSKEPSISCGVLCETTLAGIDEVEEMDQPLIVKRTKAGV